MNATPQLAASEAIVVVNRLARNGSAKIDAALEALRGHWRPSVLSVEEPARLVGQLEEAIAAGDVGCVIVAGGDGTINSALPVLVRAELPLGIIPLGTANDFARTLEIPEDPASAGEVIARGRTRRVDAARVNDAMFVNAAGIGIGSDLHEEVTGGVKKLFGKLAYPLTLLRNGWRNRPFHVYVTADGIEGRFRVLHVTVANGRHYGGGMTAHETARIDDGELDVVLVRARPLWVYLLHGMSLRTGVYAKDGPVVTCRARWLELRTRRKKVIATDGETRTTTPASFTMLAGALEVFVP